MAKDISEIGVEVASIEDAQGVLNALKQNLVEIRDIDDISNKQRKELEEKGFLRKHMIGAIAGDIIGSTYEFNFTKSTDFELFTPESRFTDDTVLTVAVADCILNGSILISFYFFPSPSLNFGNFTSI